MRRRLATFGVMAMVLGSSIGAGQQPAAQTPARADGAISGVVIDGVTKQPIEDAVVQLGWPQRREYPEFSLRQFTDAKGRFVFTDLPAGSAYVVAVSKSGYFNNVAGAVGREGGTGQTINLSDGQWVSTANVTLWPPSSISGAVIDEAGEPVIGVFVRVLAPIRIGGIDQWAVSDVTLTDDRGVYRIGKLHPGRYLVMVPSVQASVPRSTTASMLDLSQTDLARLQNGESGSRVKPALVEIDAATRLSIAGYAVPPPPIQGREFTYPITFAGATSIAQAAPVVIQAGEHRTGVDVRLDPVPAVGVSGVIDGPAEARGNLAMRLVPDGLEDLGWGGEAATTVSAPDGSFTFANVPAGRYTIETPMAMSQYTIGSMGIFYVPLLPQPPGTGVGRTGGIVESMPGFGFVGSETAAAGFWARIPIAVGARDETGVVVALQPVARMSGRLIGETTPGSTPPAAAPRFVSLQSASGSARLGDPRSSSTRTVQPGEFAIEGILPGQYLLRGNETGWMVKSVIVNGRDYTYTPIDIASGSPISDVVVTFTNAIPALSGVVRSDSGVAADAAVIAFPVEPEQWTRYGISPARIKTVQASTIGQYRFRNLPAGNYYLIAVPASLMHAWREPDFFKQAQPLATRVTIGWGEQKTADLKVSNVR